MATARCVVAHSGDPALLEKLTDKATKLTNWGNEQMDKDQHNHIL